MRHPRRVAFLLLFLAAAGSAAAAEIRAGVGGWRYDLAGTVTDRGEVYDFEDDLALQSGGRGSVQLQLDTPSGWWPDWSASYSKLGASGARSETFTLFVGGIPVGSETRSITARADFDDYDLVARYPFRWGPLRNAAGLAAKRLRGTVLIDDSEQPSPSRQQYDETFPQLYLQARWPLGRRLTLAAVAQGIEYDGRRAAEWRATAELRVWKILLLEAGWQEKRYKIDVDDYRLDARLYGVLARAGFVLR